MKTGIKYTIDKTLLLVYKSKVSAYKNVGMWKGRLLLVCDGGRKVGVTKKWVTSRIRSVDRWKIG